MIRRGTFAAFEDFTVGQTVTARFTNGGSAYEFTGKIVGQTKNYWKVEALTSPYADQGEAPGRVFHIATDRSRTYSVNNRIVAVTS